MSTIVAVPPTLAFKDGRVIIEKQFSSLLPKSHISVYLRRCGYLVTDMTQVGSEFAVTMSRRVDVSESAPTIEDQLLRVFAEMDEFGEE